MNYNVAYLGHSGFLVETENYVLLFDYIDHIKYEDNGDEVTQTNIDFNAIRKPIIMFNSHNHLDHYNFKLHKNLCENKNIITVLGDIKSKLPNTICLKPREFYKLNDIEIFTAKSTDCGVCFLVRVDNLNIYFAGDNIDWGDDDPNNKFYIDEIDYLASKAKSVDLAFIPVCNFYGEVYDSLTNSAVYAIKKLNAREMYPMHSSSGKVPYINFKNHVENLNLNCKVVVL